MLHAGCRGVKECEYLRCRGILDRNMITWPSLLHSRLQCICINFTSTDWITRSNKRREMLRGMNWIRIQIHVPASSITNRLRLTKQLFSSFISLKSSFFAFACLPAPSPVPIQSHRSTKNGHPNPQVYKKRSHSPVQLHLQPRGSKIYKYIRRHRHRHNTRFRLVLVCWCCTKKS